MQFVIVGPGALGAVFGGALARAGHDTALLGRRSTRLDALRTGGLWLQSPDSVPARLPIAITDNPSVVNRAEALIVLVKAYDTVNALTPIRRFLGAETVVLTLQNGLGNADVIRGVLNDGQPVLAGVTSQAATRLGLDLVAHTASGPTLIGQLAGAHRGVAERLAAVFSAAGLPSAPVPDIDRWIWRKAAINAAINGITSLGGFENGVLVARPDLLDAAEHVAEEAATVARALGFELGSMRGALIETARTTASNRSSMLQDLDAGRQTEVEAIHGAIHNAAVTVGIATPATDVLAALIRARSDATEAEESRRDRDQ